MLHDINQLLMFYFRLALLEQLWPSLIHLPCSWQSHWICTSSSILVLPLFLIDSQSPTLQLFTSEKSNLSNRWAFSFRLLFRFSARQKLQIQFQFLKHATESAFQLGKVSKKLFEYRKTPKQTWTGCIRSLSACKRKWRMKCIWRMKIAFPER